MEGGSRACIPGPERTCAPGLPTLELLAASMHTVFTCLPLLQTNPCCLVSMLCIGQLGLEKNITAVGLKASDMGDQVCACVHLGSMP